MMVKYLAMLLSLVAVAMGGSLLVGVWMMSFDMMTDLPTTLLLVPLSMLLSLLILIVVGLIVAPLVMLTRKDV